MKPHVLAVRLDSAGDVLLAGPAIRALRAGARRITLLCGARGRAAAELLPGVDHIVCATAPWIDPEPEPVSAVGIVEMVEAIRELEVDAAVIFTSFHQSALPTALVLRLAGVPHISAISDDYPGSLLDVRHRVDHDLHEVERNLSLAEAAGFSLPPEDDLALALVPLQVLSGSEQYVVLHPGASVSARAWHVDGYRELARILCDEGHAVVVTGARSEAPLTSALARAHPAAVDLGGRTTMRQLAEVLASAAVVVCGNTGPAHLAAAVGTPVVSLFAPTVPASRWRPWGVPHVLLGEQEIACAGCRARTCPVPGHPCIGSVAASEVADAVRTLAAFEREVCTSREAGLLREEMVEIGGRR